MSRAASPRSRSRKAWKFVIRILACPSRSSRSARHDVALAVVVVRVVRQQHAQPVADGDAGRDDQERIARSGRPGGSSSLFSACHAMSMAMTTVLPEPVAILKAMRGSPGFDVSLAGAARSRSRRRRTCGRPR